MPDNLGPVEIEFTIPEEFGKQADSAIKKMAGLTGAAVAMPKQVKAAITDQKEIIKGIEADIKSLEKSLKSVGAGTAKQEVISEANAAKRALAEEKAALSDLERQFDTSKESNRRLTYQFRDMTDQLAKMRIAGQQDTEAYRQMEAEASKLSEQMQQTRQVVKNLSDDQRVVKGLAEGVTGLSGAFSAGMGAIGLFAGENENLAKIQTKVQSLMAITIGLQQVANVLDKESAFMTVTVAKAKEMWTAAEKALTVALFGSNVAAKALMVTLTGGLAIAIPVIISLIDRWSSKSSQAAEQQQKMSDAVADSVAGPIVKLNTLSDRWVKLGNDLKARKKFIDDNKDAFKELGVKITDARDAENLLVNNKDNFIKAMMLKAQATAAMDIAAESYKKSMKKMAEAEQYDIARDRKGDIGKFVKDMWGMVTGSGYKNLIGDSSAEKTLAEQMTAKSLEFTRAWEEAMKQAGLTIFTPDKKTEDQDKAFKDRIDKVKTYYELYKMAIEQGQTAAAEAFKKQLPDDSPTFADFINKEFKAAGNDTMKLSVLLPESGEVQKSMKELLEKYKTYSDERKAIEKKYNDDIAMLTLLGMTEQAKVATQERDKQLKELDLSQPLAKLQQQYKDYDQQILDIQEKYQKDIEALKKAGLAREAAMAEQAMQKEIDAIEANKMKASTIWGSLFEDTGEITRTELEKIIATAKANMETLKETLTPDDIKAINAQIDKLQGKVDKITTKKTRSGNPFTDLADAVKRYNDEASTAADKTQALEDALNAAAAMAESLFRTADDAVEILTDLGVISKDQADSTRQTLKDVEGLVQGGLTLAAGIAAGPLGIPMIIEGALQSLSSLAKIFDVKGKKIAETQKAINDQIAQMERNYVKLQHAIDTAIGTDRFDLQREAIKKNQDEIQKYWDLVRSERSKKESKEDKDAINEWLAKINELGIANEEIIQNMSDVLLQTNVVDFSNTLLDSLVTASEEGVSAIGELNQAFDQFIKNAVLNSFKLNFIEPFVKKLTDQAYEFMKEDYFLSADEIAVLQSMFSSGTEQLISGFNQLTNALGISGDEISSAVDSTAGFGKMDQSTGNQLLGQFTALRMSAAGINDILQAEKQSRDIMRNSLIAIELNTRHAAETLVSVDGKLTEIVNDGVKIR